MTPEERQITETKDDGQMVVSDYLKLIGANWYWLVISVVICCIIAAFYIYQAPKIYKRSAQIMIKDEAKSGAGLDEMAILNELNLFSPNTNVNNEVELLKSKRMMQEVTRRLNLETTYEANGGLFRWKTVDLYRISPIAIHFLEVEEGEAFSLTATLISDIEVKITDLIQDDEALMKEPVIGFLLDTIDTPVGKMIISPTLYYSEDYIDEPINITKSQLKNRAESFSKRLSVEMNKNNTVISLYFTDNSKERADDILNTLIAVYNEDNITYKNQVVVNTSNFINERLNIIEKELGSVDKDISQYKSQHMVTDIHASTGLFLSESSNYNQQLFDLENQRSEVRYIKQYLTNPANSNNLIPANSGSQNRSIESEISEYNSLMLKRSRFIESGSERSPAVVELNNALSAMKQSIIRSIDNLIVVLDLQISGLKQRELQTNQKIANVPEKEREITVIERRLKIQENLYLYLLQKREENELAGAITTSNYRIVDEADGSPIPISPKSMLIMLAAVIIGLLIPIAIIWLRDILDTSVRNIKDITANLTVPFLGAIPLLPGHEKKNKLLPFFDAPNNKSEPASIDQYLVIKNNSRDSISEALRIVRTNIDFIREHDAPSNVIMFTSFNVGSGKSFTSINLATSFALTEKKCILVDLDLRKAVISQCVHSPQKGISGFLRGNSTELDDIIIKEPFVTNLDVLPVGVIPPNPSELLLNDRMQLLINELKQRYEYIFLDATPINIVADASIIAKMANMTVFVIREGLLDRRLLPELEALYQNGKFKNLTVLLNGSTGNSGRYGGYHRYGYGYYGAYGGYYGTYQYGYGSE